MPSSDHRATFSIRKATGADAEGILKCLASAFESYRDSYTLSAFSDTVLTPETIQQRLGAMSVFVAVSRTGEIVGTIGGNLVSAEEGHIRGMAVRPAWQGSGVAQQLLQSVESELRDEKCRRISLDTTQPLKRAVRFYEKNGYRPSGKVTDFFGMPLLEYVKIVKLE